MENTFKTERILTTSPIPESTNDMMHRVLQVDHELWAVILSPYLIAFSALEALVIATIPIKPPMQERKNPTTVATIAMVFQLVEGFEYPGI